MQKSEVADITKWTEQQVKRLSELANEGLTNIEIAPMLSEEFSEEFSWPSVRSKRTRLGLPPSEKNMRVKQTSDHSIKVNERHNPDGTISQAEFEVWKRVSPIEIVRSPDHNHEVSQTRSWVRLMLG